MKIADLDIDAIFESAFTVAGSPVVDCACGRHHVCIDSYALQNDEEDEAIRKEYIERDATGTDASLELHHGIDHLSVIEVNGIVFAEDCECKGWIPYQNFIVQNRTRIKRFLIELSEEAQQALEAEKTFNVLKDKSLIVLDEPLF